MRMKLLLIGAVLGVVGLFALQLFGPNSGGTLGPQTTYISAPLAADGLPNYALAIFELQRRGVTPENNGARLLWQAMGPMDLDLAQFQLLCKELGVSLGANDDFLDDVISDNNVNRIAEWMDSIERRTVLPGTTPHDDAANGEVAEVDKFDRLAVAKALVDEARRTAWTAANCPPLAEWVQENEGPLDLIVACAEKPQFYSPSPTVLADANTAVHAMELPHISSARAAVRSLAVRAALRIGENRHGSAWRDVHACWRLAAQPNPGTTLIEKLVAIATRHYARESTIALLTCDDLPEAIAWEVLRDLQSLPPAIRMADSFDASERYLFLDYALRSLTGRLGGGATGDSEFIDQVAGTFSCHVNVPLQTGNRWYDRLKNAAIIGDYATRQHELEAMALELDDLTTKAKSGTTWSLFSRTRRSELLGDLYVAWLLPAVVVAIDAENRDEMNLRLTQIAAALATHRARHGAYPDSLEALVPEVVAAVPQDLYGSGPPIYERRGDGYVLYSVFENGADDDGADFSGDIVGGEWVPRDQWTGVDGEHADLVIRVPRPRHAFLAEIASGEAADVADEPEPADVIQSQ